MIRARNDLVFFKPLPLIIRTSNGLFLPQPQYERTQDILLAEVTAVGPGKRLRNSDRRTIPEIKVGDIVYYDKRVAGPVTTSEGEYFACRQHELLAVMEENQ